MEAIIRIKKIAGKKINPAIFKLAEASAQTDVDFVSLAILKAKKVNSHKWEFNRNGVWYTITKWRSLSNTERLIYSESEWYSPLEFVKKSPLI
jgi:hypothetical protein